MQKSQFRKAYHAARIGQINADTIEGLAATIALEDRQKPDTIGLSFRFVYDLSGYQEKRERLETLQHRRKARRNAVEYRFDFSILNQE